MMEPLAQRRGWAWVTMAALLFTPFVIVFVSGVVGETRGAIEAPTWIAAARVIMAVLAVFLAVMAFVMERVIRKQSDRIRPAGGDPDFTVLVVGAAMFVCPACVALVVQRFGGSATDVYFWSAVSFLGLCFWAWHQRAYLAVLVASMNTHPASTRET